MKPLRDKADNDSQERTSQVVSFSKYRPKSWYTEWTPGEPISPCKRCGNIKFPLELLSDGFCSGCSEWIGDKYKLLNSLL